MKQSIVFNHFIKTADINGDTMVTRGHISNLIPFFVRRNHVWERVNKIDGHTFGFDLGYNVALSGNITLIALDKNVYLV